VGRGALMNFVDDGVVEVLSGLKDMDHLLALLNIEVRIVIEDEFFSWLDEVDLLGSAEV